MKKFVRSEEIFRVSLIYLMYGQSAVCRRSICVYLENSIAFQKVIQELRTVCDERIRKGSTPAGETPHNGGLKIRGETPAQEMGLGKRQISVIMDKQDGIKYKD